MPTTDVQSHIKYCNATFTSVSGCEQQELMGQPRNLVRRPYMPPQAFADMRSTLKSGESWAALVKTRRKNGDHDWVRANAAPMRRDGRSLAHRSAVAVREQTTGVQQMTHSVASSHEATQQKTALVQESPVAAADSRRLPAVRLSKAISVFSTR